MIQLSEEQRAIVEAPLDEKTVVMATAASGKTRTLTERLGYILKQGIDPSKVVAITFTNNASAEMQSRIDPKLREGVFIGTVHSYANMLLVSNGVDTSMYRDEEEFDKLFDLLAMNPSYLREVDYLLCDETQDLNGEQFEFIVDMINPSAYLLVGDIRQSIYGFKDARPELLLDLMSREDCVVRELTENYRNGYRIIDFSNEIIEKMKGVALQEVTPKRPIPGKIRYIRQFDILPTVKTDRNWGNWAILCRSNRKVQSILAMLTRAGIPAITFRQAQGSLGELKEKMESNAVKVLTIHSSKGLEFPKVIVADYFAHGKDEDQRINYVAVTRARDELYITKR